MLRRAFIAATLALTIATPAWTQAGVTFPPGVYVGKWVGPDGKPSDFPTTVTIEGTAPDGLVYGSQAWPEYKPWNVPAGSFNFKKGEVEGNKLVIGRTAPIVLIYTLNPNGTLSGTRTENGKPAGTITMVKQ
jgi:hypothetical protein